MKTIAKYVGGSYLYGLQTPTSDVDDRAIVVNTDLSKILGISRFDTEVRQNNKEDSVAYEIRSFMKDLKEGRPHAIEVLWMGEKDFYYFAPELSLLGTNRHRLTDVDAVYRSISGFIGGQKRETFTVGKSEKDRESKRAEAIEKYGYNPKSASHVVRLSYSASSLFDGGIYNITMYGEEQRLAFDIKVNPENYSPAQIQDIMEEKDTYMKESYAAYKEDTTFSFTFDEEIANQILLALYMPRLSEEMNKLALERLRPYWYW